MINEQIRDREVRLVSDDGEQLGVMPVKEAMRLDWLPAAADRQGDSWCTAFQ